MTIYKMDYDKFVENFKLAKKQYFSASKWVETIKGQNKANRKSSELRELAVYGIEEGWVDEFWNLVDKKKYKGA